MKKFQSKFTEKLFMKGMGSDARNQKMQSLNRRGGVPSGAAAFIASGGMGASAPIFVIYSVEASKKCRHRSQKQYGTHVIRKPFFTQ